MVKGEGERQGERIAEHIPRLRRYARALLGGDAPAADDLVQDCLERALGRLPLWRRGSDLRAWLFAIMHNVFANQTRARARRVDSFALEDSARPDPADPKACGPEAELMLDDLAQALEHLPDGQREVLLLVALEGLSYEETARALGVPVGTVMSRLSRARDSLRVLLYGHSAGRLRRIK